MTLIRVTDEDPNGTQRTVSFKKRPRVLYVEDNEMNWRVLETGLEDHFELVRSATAQEAFEQLREEQFTLILMDIELANSQFNGIEITRILKRATDAPLAPSAMSLDVRHIPIIFVTAYSARYNKTELLTAGGCDLILKPVDLDKLDRVMTRLIEYQAPTPTEDLDFGDSDRKSNERNYARREDVLSCIVHINAICHKASSTDISASGIKLAIEDLQQADCPVVGSKLALQVVPIWGGVDVVGRVVRVCSLDPITIAVEFFEPSTQIQQLLDHWLFPNGSPPP